MKRGRRLQKVGPIDVLMYIVAIVIPIGCMALMVSMMHATTFP